MQINDVTGQVVDAAMHVHSVLGPGLLESADQICLAHELGKSGLTVRREVLVPFQYDGVELDHAFRVDLLVESCVVIETKTVTQISAVHETQLLSQLRLGDFSCRPVDQLSCRHLKDGIVRKANRLWAVPLRLCVSSASLRQRPGFRSSVVPLVTELPAGAILHGRDDERT